MLDLPQEVVSPLVDVASFCQALFLSFFEAGTAGEGRVRAIASSATLLPARMGVTEMQERTRRAFARVVLVHRGSRFGIHSIHREEMQENAYSSSI